MTNAGGPLTDAELDKAAGTRLPSGINSPEEQFPRELVGWAKEWLLANAAKLDSPEAQRPFVIVFSSAPAVDAKRAANVATPSTITRYHKESYDIPQSGYIYATANFNEMYCVGQSLPSGSAALDSVLGVQFHPLYYAIFFPDQRSVAFHLPGDTSTAFAALNARQTLGGYSMSDLSIEMLDELLAKFHVQAVATSNCFAGMSLWKLPFEDRSLVTQAERTIQGHLATFLSGKFDKTSVHLDWEVNTGGGRADIRLLRLKPGTTDSVSAAYLELKVVRHNKSQNDMQKWVNEGILQAYDYVQSQVPPSELGLACCYNNHEKGDAIELSAQPLANEKKVYLRFYEIKHLPSHSINTHAV